jgi:phosphomannomutase
MREHQHFVDTTWEGIFATDFTLEQVRRCGEHLGQALAGQGKTCLVAYDNRFMSDLFARDLYQYLEQQGIAVVLGAMSAPLPAIYHALRQGQADCALVVSACNKPYWYNGLVFFRPDDLAISLFPDNNHPIQHNAFPPFPPAMGSLARAGAKGKEPKEQNEPLDLRRSYLDVLLEQIDEDSIRRSTMTIFVDSMHGTTAGYIPAIIGEQSQTMAIEINREIDPLFNKFTPLPAATSLTRLRKLVRESDSHLGLAFSADGTALGVVDKSGEPVEQIDVVLLLTDYLVRQYRQKGVVIAPALGSEHSEDDDDDTLTMSGLEAWGQSLGIRMQFSSNPSEHIAEMLRNTPQDLLIGCTPEGGITVGQYSNYPDALLSGLLIVEMVARSGGNLQTHLNQIRKSLNEA